jgi:Tfp pilus assembly protein PilF
LSAAIACKQAPTRRRYAKAHFNLGNLLLAAGDKPSALTHFKNAVALDPHHLATRTKRAAAATSKPISWL